MRWGTVAAWRAAFSPAEEDGWALGELGRSDFVEMLERHGTVDRYSELAASGLRMSHYTAGLKLDLPMVSWSRMKLFADLGVGATRIRSSRLSLYRESGGDISETYLSLRGGLTLELTIAARTRAFLSGREFVYLDEDDGATLEELRSGSRILESGSWTFPLTVGLRLGI